MIITPFILANPLKSPILSDKRVALSEAHQLCVVVFDFLQYGVLLLRQRSG
jgi:hypothetical protein